MRKFSAKILAFSLATYAAQVSAAPVVISQCTEINASGSYVLSQNLPNKMGGNSGLLQTGHCIEVNADDVTIDLAGFVISGFGGGARTGINTKSAVRSITIRNGTITGFITGIAVDQFAIPPGTSNALVESINAIGNFSGGILINGAATVSRSIASNNGFVGIQIWGAGNVAGNIASNNGALGIIVGHGSIVTDNVANGNGDGGIPQPNNIRGSGISASSGSIINGNTVRSNTNFGIRGQDATTVTGNTVTNNGGFGIRVNPRSTVAGNTVIGNQLGGVAVDCPSNVIGNTVTGNTGPNISFPNAGTCQLIDNLF